MFKLNQIVYIPNLKRFAIIKSYKKGLYICKTFAKRENETAFVSNKETNTYEFKKPKSNFISVPANSIQKINISFSYWIIYNLRFFSQS